MLGACEALSLQGFGVGSGTYGSGAVADCTAYIVWRSKRRPMTPEQRLQLRQKQSRPILDKLHDYL